jgi:hypothetical protein
MNEQGILYKGQKPNAQNIRPMYLIFNIIISIYANITGIVLLNTVTL